MAIHQGVIRLAEAGTWIKTDQDLRADLQAARQAEAAHFEALQGLRDSKSIRLQLLKDDLAPIVASSPEAADLFDLALVPGEVPKLWIDLITAVVMEPDHRTYRLIEDHQDGRDVVLESSDRAEMVARIRQLMAHRIVVRQRRAAAEVPIPSSTGYSAGSVILAWLAGFSLGALALLALAMSLDRIRF
ncbi:MAG: hypothetical protein KDK89_11300 [Alphaproteobacteria bacterium]|nr:hypothetical protein [Alphaproteobacteria bacterium]